MDKNEHSIARWISILYRYGQGYIGKNIESYNIGSGQYIFLIALYKKEGISQEQISEYLKVDKATTAKAIKRLEKEGYIRRAIDENDKRAYKIYLTQKALNIKSELYDVIREWENMLSSGLSENEKEIFLKMLKNMAENASNNAQATISAIMDIKNTTRSEKDYK